jgi:hypothetical protein
VSDAHKPARIELDRSRLLGFDQLPVRGRAAAAADEADRAARDGAMRGTGLAAMIGDTKIGAKLGVPKRRPAPSA